MMLAWTLSLDHTNPTILVSYLDSAPPVVACQQHSSAICMRGVQLTRPDDVTRNPPISTGVALSLRAWHYQSVKFVSQNRQSRAHEQGPQDVPEVSFTVRALQEAGDCADSALGPPAVLMFHKRVMKTPVGFTSGRLNAEIVKPVTYLLPSESNAGDLVVRMVRIQK